MASEPESHRNRALDAIERAEQGGPEEVYATLAVAQALLAVQDVLVDIRDEIERAGKRASRSSE